MNNGSDCLSNFEGNLSLSVFRAGAEGLREEGKRHGLTVKKDAAFKIESRIYVYFSSLLLEG